MEGGKQPFHPEDAVMIYTETDDVRTSVYFAEINDITGQLFSNNGTDAFLKITSKR